ncbi:hypothetical protein LTR66_007345 [Elasticomyces elasticus]|nr:hypothetical protein LTR66_007345 [Elasticomyces elasticus]
MKLPPFLLPPRQGPLTFRFDVDAIEDTVFFVRKESSPTELIANLQGYGHTLPEAYSTWDPGVGRSCSHQRIIKYGFDLFNNPKVKDIGQEVIRWDNNNSALLARFHALVKRIVGVVRDSDQQQCEIS